MLSYPHRDEDDVAALKRVARSAYAEDDMPFLRVARYSLSPDYEFDDVMAKTRVDMQGAMDMQYSLKQWQNVVFSALSETEVKKLAKVVASK